MQNLSSTQASPEVPLNENFETLEHLAVYGKRQPVTTGLTWGYYGGRWGGTSIADGTVTLTDSTTNYLVVARSTGTLTGSTSTTNWNNIGQYARVYKLTTSGGVVTAEEDHRAGPNGVHGQTIIPGRHSIPVMATAMTPSASGGCAPLATAATSAGHPDLQTLNFDSTTAEYAQFSVALPKRWNLGTIICQFLWSHPATVTNFGVAWNLQAVAVSDDDTIDVAYGTAVTVTDTGGTTNDLYRTAESSAMTVGGSPAEGDVVFFRVYRDPAHGSDNMAVDARLHGVVLHITTTTANDD